MSDSLNPKICQHYVDFNCWLKIVDCGIWSVKCHIFDKIVDWSWRGSIHFHNFVLLLRCKFVSFMVGVVGPNDNFHSRWLWHHPCTKVCKVFSTWLLKTMEGPPIEIFCIYDNHCSLLMKSVGTYKCMIIPLPHRFSTTLHGREFISSYLLVCILFLKLLVFSSLLSDYDIVFNDFNVSGVRIKFTTKSWVKNKSHKMIFVIT